MNSARNEDLVVSDALTIPAGELEVSFARSSGPGGQHVNKVETRVTLRFDLAGSAVLSESQQARIAARLATRISKAGVLRVVCQKHRSQSANEREARVRLAALLAAALVRPPRRRKTAVPKAQRRRRLEGKRRRSRLKQDRRRPPSD